MNAQYQNLLDAAKEIGDSDLDELIEKMIPFPLKIRYRVMLIKLFQAVNALEATKP